MPRPRKCRRIGFAPDVLYFKPAGIPLRDLDEIGLSLDELEALRLADLEGFYQEDAAEKMGVSRQTFANIVMAAHKKIAESLIHGKALRIEGYEAGPGGRTYSCRECSHTWIISIGEGGPSFCPRCKSPDIQPIIVAHDLEDGRGFGRKRKRFCRKDIQEETE